MPTKETSLLFAHRRGLNLGVKAALVAAVLLTFSGPARAYFVPSTHQAATLVLGQANFTSNGFGVSQTRMYYPGGVAVDAGTHKVFVADTFNNRVLRFASEYALANGAAAEAVLGQTNFTDSGPATTQSGMYGPHGVFVDAGGRLWVADATNNRVLRFDHAGSRSSGAKADGVLGQPNFASSGGAIAQSGMQGPYGVVIDSGGRLWVADWANNRVLRFDNAASKANGANADGVLGQANFTENYNVNSQSGMAGPNAVAVDSSGRLWVADTYHNRVLRFNSAAAKANGANADGVLGQTNFTNNGLATSQNTMYDPSGVTVDANGRLYVADTFNNRILVFNAASGLANGANASYVLGQPNFTTGTANTGGISASTLFYPVGVFYDPKSKVLWAGDAVNNRVLMYGKPSKFFATISAGAYDGYVLESTETSGAGGIASPSGSLRAGDDVANEQYRSILYFNTSSLPDSGITIRSVTLKIKKSGVTGTNPFTTHGYLLADIKKGTFGAAALEITDFQAAASASGIGHFNYASGGWYRLIVPSSKYMDINLAGITQFRIRFATDDNNDNGADYVSFYAGDDSISSNRPVLSIEYTKP